MLASMSAAAAAVLSCVDWAAVATAVGSAVASVAAAVVGAVL